MARVRAEAAPPRPTAIAPFKERQKGIREEAIIEAARDLFAARGYAGTTLDDVIAIVGISKPTFYQHFTSKEELGARILVRMIGEARAEVARLRKILPPDQALREMINWAVDKTFATEAYFRLAGATQLSVNQAVTASEREMVADYAMLIEEGQKAGLIRTGVSPQLAAQTISSIIKDTMYAEDLVRGCLDLQALKEGIAALVVGP